MMAFTLYPREMSQVPGRDPAFMEAISKNMRVPERLSIGPGQQWRQVEEGEDTTRGPEQPPPTYTMQVPDRLTYTGRFSVSVFLNKVFLYLLFA